HLAIDRGWIYHRGCQHDRLVACAVTENDFLKRVLDLAKLSGFRVAHFRPAMTRSGDWVTRMDGHNGFPDLVLTKGGRLLFCELKVGSNKLTDAQEQWLERLRQVPGVEVYVWKPQHFEQIIQTLTT